MRRRARARELLALTLSDGLSRIALSPDGKLLAIGDRTGQVSLLDASNFETIGLVRDVAKPNESFWPPALTFSPDGRSLAVGSQQGTISLWSLEAPAHPHLRVHLPGHRGPVINLVYDPHGSRLASRGHRSSCRSLGP